MTQSARVLTAHAVLDQLMANVGVDGLIAAMRAPGIMAAVDQHAAVIRETLHAADHPVDVVSLAAYAHSVLAVLNRCGHQLPEPADIDWPRAGAHLLRLVAVCSLAESADLL